MWIEWAVLGGGGEHHVLTDGSHVAMLREIGS